MLKSCSSLQRDSQQTGRMRGGHTGGLSAWRQVGGSVVEKNETKYAINLNSHQDDYFLPCSANIKISCNGKRRTQNKQREQQRQQQLRKMAVKVAHILHASGTQNAYESKSSWNYHINQATTTALQQLATSSGNSNSNSKRKTMSLAVSQRAQRWRRRSWGSAQGQLTKEQH